jgi:hypothetical protein
MATVVTKEGSSGAVLVFDSEPLMGLFRITTRWYLRTVVVIALALILLWYGLIAFARLQISDYPEAREQKLREKADSLLVEADRAENRPGSGNRWMIMAADQR